MRSYTGPTSCSLAELVDWTAALRAVGVTKVALGDYEATIEPLPMPEPKRDEGLLAEQHDLDTMSS